MRQVGVRESLYVIIFEAETPLGQAFDVTLLLLIVASVTTTCLETVHSVAAHHLKAFWVVERCFTGLFAAEYAMRACVAKPNAKAYVCSFFGVVDLMSILPTLLEELTAFGGSSIRTVRVLRLLRVFRVLHMAGLNAEAEALGAAFLSARRKIFVFLLAILAIVTIMGTAIYILEDNEHSGFTSIPRSIYWAIVTVTTVGYGDIAARWSPDAAAANWDE